MLYAVKSAAMPLGYVLGVAHRDGVGEAEHL